MSPIAITLILLLVAVVLFATEKIPVDIVGILLVIGLVMTNVLTMQEGLSGFGDNVIIIIAGLFVLTGGMVKTGIVDLIGRRLYRIAGDNEFLLTSFDNGRRRVLCFGVEKYDDDGDVRAGRFGFGKSREDFAVETFNAARFRRDFGRKLHFDRHFDEFSGQRCDSAIPE